MFYERFMQLCKANNERPCNVLKEIGVSSGALTNWKNGSSVQSKILILLSDHFNVSVDYILGREEQDITNVNDTQVNASTDIELSKDKQYDETAVQVAEMFSNMNIKDKAKVLSFMIELSER